MDEATLFAKLKAHRTVGSAPESELRWLLAHGVYDSRDAGQALYAPTDRMRHLAIILSGRFAIYVDRGAGPRKVMEWRGGDVSGLLPFSRMVVAPGATVIEEWTDVLQIEDTHLPELIRECPNVTATLVHIMVDRARTFVSSDWQDEKMVSLGKLAAGLAHELNNPSAAAARSASLLRDALAHEEEASRALAGMRLTPTQLATLDRVHGICLMMSAPSERTPLERADREEVFADWLSQHGADPTTAATLAETPAEVDTLELLSASLDGVALDASIRWIAAGCLARSLASDVEHAVTRVHELVASMKRFSYMDRASAPDTVDVGPGIEDAVRLLSAKIRGKNATVSVAIAPDLPKVWGFGGDFNQVWSNLVDNAVDAVAPGGTVSVSAGREGQWVIVRVVDDGPGIPEPIRGRIFDAFFTTKPPGQGTGLGLDIARRIVRRYTGEIEFDSEPGRTEFRVRLPLPVAAATPTSVPTQA